MADRLNSHSAERRYHVSVESDVDVEGIPQLSRSRPVQPSDAKREFKPAAWNAFEGHAHDREQPILKGVKYVSARVFAAQAGQDPQIAESPTVARPRPTKRDDTWASSETSEPVRPLSTTSISGRPQIMRSESTSSTYGLQVARLSRRSAATPLSTREGSRRSSVHGTPSAAEYDNPGRYPSTTVQYPGAPEHFRAGPPPFAGHRSSRDDDRHRLASDEYHTDSFDEYYDRPHVRRPSTRSYDGVGFDHTERSREEYLDDTPPGVNIHTPEKKRHQHAREPVRIIQRGTSSSSSGSSGSDETPRSVSRISRERKRGTGRRMPSTKREDEQHRVWEKLLKELEEFARLKMLEEQRAAEKARKRATEERIMIEREVKERIERENKAAAEARDAEARRHEEFLRLMQAKLQHSVDEMVTMTKEKLLQGLGAGVMNHPDAERKSEQGQRQAEVGAEVDTELETKVASRREGTEQARAGRRRTATKSSQDTLFPSPESASSIQLSGSSSSGASSFAPGRRRPRRAASSEPRGWRPPRAPPQVPKAPSVGNQAHGESEDKNESQSNSESESEIQTSATSHSWTAHWRRTKEGERRKTLRMIREELVNPIAEALAAGLAGRSYAYQPPMPPPESTSYGYARWHGERWRGRGSDPATYDFNDREAESYRSDTERSRRGRWRSERWPSPAGWQEQRWRSPSDTTRSVESWRQGEQASHRPPHGHTVGHSDPANGAPRNHDQGLDLVRVDPVPAAAEAVGGDGVDIGTKDVQPTPQPEPESRGPQPLVERQASPPLRSEKDSFIQANHHLAPTEVNSDALPDDLAKEQLVVPEVTAPPPPAQPWTRTPQRNVPDGGPESFRSERFGARKLLLVRPRLRRSKGVVGYGSRSVSGLTGSGGFD